MKLGLRCLIKMQIDENPSRRDPVSSPDRYFPCAICGQIVDRNHMGQMFHHDGMQHEALPPDAR